MPKPSSPRNRDMAFLTEQFDIPPFKAAELLAGQTPQAEKLLDQEYERRNAADTLADVPTPKPPGDASVDGKDQNQLKPITRHNNMRGAT